MASVFAGTPRGRFRHFADDKKSYAGVTILGKLSREMAAWASARRGKWGQVTPWKNG